MKHAGITGSGLKGSICPEVVMCEEISACDRAIKDLPSKHQTLITYRYKLSGTEEDRRRVYMHDTGYSERTWRRMTREAHVKIADWIWMHSESMK